MMCAIHHQPNAGSHRRGAFLVVALVCLVLATAMVGVVLSLVQTQRRQMVQQQAELQSEWLAESGLERAVSRLRRDRAYRGETWTIDPENLGGTTAGKVLIDIQPSASDSNSFSVRIEAIYGSIPGQGMRRARQTTIVLKQET